MAHLGILNFSWNTYTDYLRIMLKDMLNTKALSDITLVSDDHKQIQAHKFVLCASSRVFKHMIITFPLNSMIYLRGIKFKELQGILNFIYCGEASIDENRTNEFLKVASDLEIQGLVKEVKNHLKENPADVDDSSGEVEDMVESDVNINHKDYEDNVESDNFEELEGGKAEESINEMLSDSTLMELKSEEVEEESEISISNERIPNWLEGRLNKKGKPAKIMEKDGFTYCINKSLHKDRLDRVYFRCLNRSRNCRASAIIDLEKNLILEISYDEIHNHPPDTASHVVKVIEEEAFKKGLEDIDLKPTDLYRSMQENVLNSEVGEKGLTYLKPLMSFRRSLESRRIKSGIKIKQSCRIYKKEKRKIH